ncbi:MAG: RidA family protein [Planctomycetota bacterium]|nr:MAG: RidA family protein [Planctomycetota bacterium]
MTQPHGPRLESIQPAGWAAPRGYSNAVAVSGATKLVFVAGQIAWDAQQQLVGAGDFAAQFEQALSNVVACLRAAGAQPEAIARLTIYVTDKRAYLAATKEIGAAYKRLVGKHYPAMALVQVAALLEDGALVEIEATAAV